jgi:ABC-type Na+ transport system ATPase subunit NatA
MVVTINAPANYRRLLGQLPDHVNFSNRVTANSMFVHLFTTKRNELQRRLSILRNKLSDNGAVWVSWPKKSSGISTDVTEDVIREIALPLGFVDIKVCAVDETRSGLKLMIRRENRKSR